MARHWRAQKKGISAKERDQGGDEEDWRRGDMVREISRTTSLSWCSEESAIAVALALAEGKEEVDLDARSRRRHRGTILSRPRAARPRRGLCRSSHKRRGSTADQRAASGRVWLPCLARSLAALNCSPTFCRHDQKVNSAQPMTECSGCRTQSQSRTDLMQECVARRVSVWP